MGNTNFRVHLLTIQRKLVISAEEVKKYVESNYEDALQSGGIGMNYFITSLEACERLIENFAKEEFSSLSPHQLEQSSDYKDKEPLKRKTKEERKKEIREKLKGTEISFKFGGGGVLYFDKRPGLWLSHDEVERRVKEARRSEKSSDENIEDNNKSSVDVKSQRKSKGGHNRSRNPWENYDTDYYREQVSFSPEYRSSIENSLSYFVNDGDPVACMGYFKMKG
jgi:5'-3' exonuclease